MAADRNHTKGVTMNNPDEKEIIYVAADPQQPGAAWAAMATNLNAIL